MISSTPEPASPGPTSSAAPVTQIEARPTEVEAPPREPATAASEPAAPERAGSGSAGPEPAGRSDPWAGRYLDLSVILFYLAAAIVVLAQLWHSPGSVTPAENHSDPRFFEWALLHAERIFTHGENPFATPQLNAPLGVNMIANTGFLAMTVPLVPVTALFGPSASLVLMITLGLAATASAWYLVLSRHLVRSRLAAAIGGAIAGFAPGMINHANAHPNLVAQFLFPFILWRALTMRTVRHGIVLGLLVTWQAFLNEELLFLAALAAALFVVGYAVWRPREIAPVVRPFLTGGVAAVVVAAVLLAYPIWYQFFGPEHYSGLPAQDLAYGTDLASYVAFPKLSLIGQSAADAQLAPTPEENTFFGWPVLLALLVIVVWLWRRVSVRALTLVGLVFFVLSLGPTIFYRGRTEVLHGPWSWINRLPLFDSVVPVRLGLVVIPVVAILFGYAFDELLQRRYLWMGPVLAAALIPIIPRAVPVDPRPPVPAFFTSGDWRAHLSGNRSVLNADTSWEGNIEAMSWDNATGQGYRMVGGYFLAPDQSGQGTYGPVPRPTSALLSGVGSSGKVPAIGDQEREQARQDVMYWDLGLVVLASNAPHETELHASLDQLFGQGQRVDDVWLWNVSALSQ